MTNVSTKEEALPDASIQTAHQLQQEKFYF